MRSIGKRLVLLLIAFMLILPSAMARSEITLNLSDISVDKDGEYETMEEVAAYIYLYGGLPDNYITKNEAKKLGWVSNRGNLDEVAPGKSIGGDHFGNYEGSLPDKKGRKWTECDIGSDGGYRNGLRICFSSDGLIYYSDDHYNTFSKIVFVEDKKASEPPPSSEPLDEYGEYLSKEEVALFLNQYGTLPLNYLTKNEAKELGWSNSKDNLGDIMPGCAIGGDKFGNREGLLPDKEGREWRECDVNTKDGRRGKERIVYSNDGLIYYTSDGYQSFEQLY